MNKRLGIHLRKPLLFFFVIGLVLAGWIEIRAEDEPGLAILPFFMEMTEDPARGAVCPVCKGIYQRGKILPGSQNTLTELLYSKVEGLGKFRVLPFATVEGAASRQGKDRFEKRPVSSAVTLGRELNVDFVLLGFLFRFEERMGSSVGVEKPASVGFDLHLFRTRDGAEVWKGRFDETQKSLSEDLFKIGSFLRRRGSWLTAAELAGDGMEALLKKLPDAKELEGRP